MLFVINLPALWLLEETSSTPDLLISADFLCPVHETVSPFKYLNVVENMWKMKHLLRFLRLYQFDSKLSNAAVLSVHLKSNLIDAIID